jgi:hypothetical protein
MTGGRIKRIALYIGNETFCLTYGDGVSDVDIRALVNFPSCARTPGDDNSGALVVFYGWMFAVREGRNSNVTAGEQ